MSSHYFERPRHVRMNDPTFITADNYNYHAHGPGNGDKEAFKLLQENIAEEAIHNSDERCDAPKVHPETRKAVQEEIFGWISNGDEDSEPKKILWLSGPAGAGKTAIAGSIAEICEDRGLLAGSFFFSSYSGSEKRRSKRCVVATLVYSLLRHETLQSLRGPILSIIERDPAIFRTSLRNQCRMLLLKPFYDALGHLDLSALPKFILLDGLDEVGSSGSRQHEARLANEADQVEILHALLQAAQDPRFPFRIIVVSRPERVISDFFATQAKHLSREIFLDDKYNPDSDIALFLRARFAEIRRRYRMAAAWPSEHEIGQLVSNASGQFIYAATVIRALEGGKSPNPQAILRTILDTAASLDPSHDPLAPLNALYSQILSASPDPQLAVRWFSVSELDMFSAWFVRRLLQDFDGQAEYLLENLSSLVKIPSAGDRISSYEIYHKSLYDFLGSAQRCGQVLKESFDAGTDLFCERWFGVLTTRSPVVPVVDSDWPYFLEVFLNATANPLHGYRPYVPDHHSCESVVATCDVGAWVREVNAKFITQRDRASGFLQHMFDMFHELCNDEGPCTKACQHWNSNILGECKSLGWGVPDVVLLYCRDIWEWAGLSVRGVKLSGFTFQPPKSRSRSSLPPPQDIVELRARQKRYLDEYNAQCEIINLIRFPLPDRWRSDDSAIETIISTIRMRLRKFAPEVGLRLESLEALQAEDGEDVDEADSGDSRSGEVGEGDTRVEPHLPGGSPEEVYSAFGAYCAALGSQHSDSNFFEGGRNPLAISGSSGESASGSMAQTMLGGSNPDGGTHLCTQPSPPSGHWNVEYNARPYGATFGSWNAPLAAPSNILSPRDAPQCPTFPPIFCPIARPELPSVGAVARQNRRGYVLG